MCVCFRGYLPQEGRGGEMWSQETNGVCAHHRPDPQSITVHLHSTFKIHQSRRRRVNWSSCKGCFGSQSIWEVNMHSRARENISRISAGYDSLFDTWTDVTPSSRIRSPPLVVFYFKSDFLSSAWALEWFKGNRTHSFKHFYGKNKRLTRETLIRMNFSLN